MRVLLAIALGLALSWALLVVLLFALRPRGIDFAEAKRFVPDVVGLARRLAKDPVFGRGVRIRLMLLLAYLAMPLDPVPDFIPLLGFADDVIVVALVLRSVVRVAGLDAIDRHWQGTPAGLALVRRLTRTG